VERGLRYYVLRNVAARGVVLAPVPLDDAPVRDEPAAAGGNDDPVRDAPARSGAVANRPLVTPLANENDGEPVATSFTPSDDD
jgi:hypothetical protein